MSRTAGWLLGVLVVAALLVGVNVAAAASGWARVWRGFNDFNLSVTDVRVTSDRAGVNVTVAVSNRAGATIRVLEIDSSVDLNGHTVADGSASPDNLRLAGGQSSALVVPNAVGTLHQSALTAQMATPARQWNISGRVQIEVDDQSSTTTWVPYAFAVTQP